MILKRSKVITFIVILSTVLCCMPNSVKGAETNGYISANGIKINKSGMCEIVGHLSTGRVGSQIAILLTLVEDTKKLQVSDVVYIDQVETGNNGTFIVRFLINYKYANKLVYVKFGSNTGEKTQKYTVRVPDIPPDISVVENNSALYGKDAYYIPGAFHTPNNIAESMSYGGNNIYYKLGDKWYNLLDKKATDNSYLIPENATSISKIEDLKPRYYYFMVSKVKMKYEQ